ncbi:2-amino-4-hydroxy-6-hydroxymethyldihydropteridine diphosphokinase [Sphingomonas sp. BK235]|uniref:2-amino-4-hydroxy-6- hydroxymethyldihydropteridine diphosphokinase n=1 Tax=Sphingomonas sp. BK235 TaxID=2512131 RepID=UPI00104F7FE2|nr:2-amino-4-hydroxy-6-hydroxymethyldihydropteridine diphosphokinase [Sphingomonas sp. BK235]TCP34173.1 2-amino-4-hydroxy-6-hydroxymethyldihydropteridine diphosphokinase [Sphingomonas sp. BK235]
MLGSSHGRHLYLIGVGGNRRGRHGGPRAEVAAALAELGGRAAPIVASAPLGPSTRTFANAAALIETDAPPEALLARLKAIERHFGRRRGRRWGARVIDLDVILWSGGRWESPRLSIPHRAYRSRAFVLAPLVALAPRWRDPRTGHTLRQLHARLTKPRAVPRPARIA